jgi:hypothetical protein
MRARTVMRFQCSARMVGQADMPCKQLPVDVRLKVSSSNNVRAAP